MSSELRKDLFSDRWIILVNNDNNFIPDKDSKLNYKNTDKIDKNCPFCLGNESKTKFNIAEYKKDEKWQVRVIPNNRPYLRVEPQLKRYSKDIFSFISGTGANEVIIETPIHNIDIDEMDIDEISLILKCYKDRFLDLKKDERFEYIIILKSRGEKAGAKISHLYSQLFAFPVIPPLISEELNEAQNYFKIKNRCVYCDVIDSELKLNERIVLINEDFLCFAPFASRVNFELIILPKNHKAHYYELNEKEIINLSYILKEIIYKLNIALGYSSYNIILHSSPLKMTNIEYYHWHIEILPKLKNFTGFEQATGLFINSTPPEEVARYLKSIKI